MAYEKVGLHVRRDFGLRLAGGAEVVSSNAAASAKSLQT